MSYCDVCGSPIKGEPLLVEIDEAVLALCSDCARRYVSSKEVRFSKAEGSTTRIKRRDTRRGTTFRVNRSVDRYEIVEDYAELVKSARENLGMSREVLAKTLGIKESIIKKIEEGQLIPDIDLARRLEKILNVRLLTESENENTEVRRNTSKELTLGDVVVLRRRDSRSSGQE